MCGVSCFGTNAFHIYNYIILLKNRQFLGALAMANIRNSEVTCGLYFKGISKSTDNWAEIANYQCRGQDERFILRGY
jgi:hypothetical protein